MSSFESPFLRQRFGPLAEPWIAPTDPDTPCHYKISWPGFRFRTNKFPPPHIVSNAYAATCKIDVAPPEAEQLSDTNSRHCNRVMHCSTFLLHSVRRYHSRPAPVRAELHCPIWLALLQTKFAHSLLLRTSPWIDLHSLHLLLVVARYLCQLRIGLLFTSRLVGHQQSASTDRIPGQPRWSPLPSRRSWASAIPGQPPPR